MSAATEIRWRKRRNAKEWYSTAGYLICERESDLFETTNPAGHIVIIGFDLRQQQILADELAREEAAS